MSKKIEMTPTQASLFSEMKKLSKRANQRIVRLERLTGTSESFAVKQLADYLSSDTLNAWTEKGRSSVIKGLTEGQMKAVIKALNQFLKNDLSTQQGIKNYTKEKSEKAGVILDYKKANVFYQAEKSYKWIYKYFEDSKKGNYYWDFAREMVNNNWGVDKFIENIMQFITDKSLDESLKQDLTYLYEYSKGVKG